MSKNPFFLGHFVVLTNASRPARAQCGMMEPILNTGENRMSLEQDIEKLAAQEQRLQLDRFDNAAAWELGTRIKAICEALGVAVTT